MKKHAYMIIAHTDLEMLGRLIHALDYPLNDLYIHIDKKVYNPELLEKFVTVHSNLSIISSVDIRWGTYSVVECELLLLKTAIQKNYSYFHLLSGMDYPLKSCEEIYTFFEKSGKEFIHFSEERISNENMERILFRHVNLGRFKTSKYKIVNKYYFVSDTLCCKLQRILRLQKPLLFKEYQKGSQWFSITKGLAEYIINNFEIVKNAFENTYIPDELFLQTLVINSNWKEHLYDKSRDNSNNQNMRYIDWTRGNPYVFKKEDFNELVESDCMFARKFSTEIDSAILDMLDFKNKGEN